MTPKVLGIDLSLTCTGLAGNGWTAPLRPPTRLRGVERLIWIRQQITGLWLPGVDLVAVEGPSYGSQSQGRQSGHHERAGLWWLIRVAIASRGVPVAVVPPATLKRYATGKGNAGKDQMVLAAARRFEWYAGTEDEADALMLAAMAADYLGAPMVTMPTAHRAALDAVDWPDLPVPVCRHELHGADGGPCPGCGHDSHPIPVGLAPIVDLGLPTLPPVAAYDEHLPGGRVTTVALPDGKAA